jgi:DnaK suppressor protein
MTKMTKTKLNKFRKLYEHQRAAILQQIGNQDFELDVAGDDVDQIQGAVLTNVARNLSDRDTVRLEKIDIALNKIAHGTFGICESCGENIGEKRLEIIPGVEICINCAELEEKEAKQFQK